MDLIIAGDVQTILRGQVTPDFLQPVSVKALPFALGGAALPNAKPLEIGETIIYEGTGHIFTVKEPWSETKDLRTAFLMGIERKPKEQMLINSKQSIETLYEDLIQNHPDGFVIIGKVHFSTLSVAYLQLSPIHGENVNDLHDKYWHTETLTNQEAKLFGVVMKNPDPRAFYHNPNEQGGSSVHSHSHVLCPFARHLLTDSELTSGNFWIEAIDEVKSF